MVECKHESDSGHGAIYAHSKGHSVNWTIVHASKVPLVKCMMDTVQHIAFSVHYSAHRLRVFQAELELDEDVQAGLNSVANLQSLCKTKWSIRANAL